MRLFHVGEALGLSANQPTRRRDCEESRKCNLQAQDHLPAKRRYSDYHAIASPCSEISIALAAATTNSDASTWSKRRDNSYAIIAQVTSGITEYKLKY